MFVYNSLTAYASSAGKLGLAGGLRGLKRVNPGVESCKSIFFGDEGLRGRGSPDAPGSGEAGGSKSGPDVGESWENRIGIMNTAAQSAGILSFEQADGLVREYCRRILDRQGLRTEEIPLLQGLGRVLAEPILADRDFPPFPRATRDGYAVRAADVYQAGLHQADLDQTAPMPLRVVGQVKAGDSYDLPLAAGEAVEIMTGAAVPQGADAVVMVEYTARKNAPKMNRKGREGSQREEGLGRKTSDTEDVVGNLAGDVLGHLSNDVLGNLDEHILGNLDEGEQESPEKPQAVADELIVADEWVEIQRAVLAGENIVPAGAEARAGQELLPRGVRLGPAQIALAAAAGKASVSVYRKPRVAILSTGDELVEVAEKPGPSQIRNSNSYSLAAQVAAGGGEPVQLPIAPDEESKLAELIQEGLKADMLLLSGGVSMGKFDLVEKALATLGAEFYFTGAMIQPGKPVVCGEIQQGPGSLAKEGGHGAGGASTAIAAKDPGQGLGRSIPFFGLPGNPVSVMVTFEFFARQVLEALSGAEPARLKSAKARLKKDFKTKTGLTRFLPARLEGGLENPEVEVVPWQGSGDMLAAARANCYLVVPPDREKLAGGEMVTVVMR
jgi:molybdenum cofactor synthesis domain-containing protein